jgi:hypothetical protein
VDHREQSPPSLHALPEPHREITETDALEHSVDFEGFSFGIDPAHKGGQGLVKPQRILSRCLTVTVHGCLSSE